MKVGLFFGSFNPIHNAHLIIARHILNFSSIKELWFVVSPQNPFKNQKNLLNEQHRLNLVRLAIEGEKQMCASNIEFKLPRPSYTADTLHFLLEKYPNYEFSLILGSDSFQNIFNWKNPEYILKNIEFIIYPRPGFELTKIVGASQIVVKAPLLDISSTLIRYLLRERKSIHFLVPEIIYEEIEKQGYYSSVLENPTEQ